MNNKKIKYGVSIATYGSIALLTYGLLIDKLGFDTSVFSIPLILLLSASLTILGGIIGMEENSVLGGFEVGKIFYGIANLFLFIGTAFFFVTLLFIIKLV